MFYSPRMMQNIGQCLSGA